MRLCLKSSSPRTRGEEARSRVASMFLVHLHVAVLAHEDHADHQRHRADGHREPQAREGVLGLFVEELPDERHHAAEDTVADVVRQRHRRVADARGKELDEERRDRPVDHRDVDDQDGQDQHQREGLRVEDVEEMRGLDDRRVGSAGIACRRQRGTQILREARIGDLEL
ncbi:MAG: hypothetical protein ACK56F_16300, partial [bacterium]